MAPPSSSSTMNSNFFIPPPPPASTTPPTRLPHHNLLPFPILSKDPPGVQHGGYPHEAEEKDVQEELAAAAAFEQDGEGWQKEG